VIKTPLFFSEVENMDKRKETDAVKKALKKAGIIASVTHIGKYRENLKIDVTYPERTEPPNGYGAKYATEEVYINLQVERIVKEITGRPERGDGGILLW
jgi:hypothetical protein